MWKPAGARLGSPRLGQVSQSVVDQAARSVVAEAEPKVRDIVREERVRLAEAGMAALPWTALSAAGFTGTAFLAQRVPSRVAGFGAAAVLLGVGLWRGFSILAGPAPPAPKAPGTELPLVGDVARQMARAIVREADPLIRDVVEKERNRLAQATGSALPWVGAGVASLAGTAFVMPDTWNVGKAAGYTLAAFLGLVGLWRGLETAKTA